MVEFEINFASVYVFWQKYNVSIHVAWNDHAEESNAVQWKSFSENYQIPVA